MTSPPGPPSDTPPALTAAATAWRDRLQARLAELARPRERARVGA